MELQMLRTTVDTFVKRPVTFVGAKRTAILRNVLTRANSRTRTVDFDASLESIRFQLRTTSHRNAISSVSLRKVPKVGRMFRDLSGLKGPHPPLQLTEEELSSIVNYLFFTNLS